jgi:hypothetical protein
VQKSLGHDTTLEIGYQGERGYHLQQSYLINNAQPGPGAIQPRRPYPTATFLPGTVIPSNVTVASTTFPVSTVNLFQDTARSWYDAGYVNIRRRYSHGLSLLANYTYSKNLSNAPDFRSPMFEAAIPQNDNDLNTEKGLSRDIRNRFVLSAVYDIPSLGRDGFVRVLTRNWRLSTIYQVQSGFPAAFATPAAFTFGNVGRNTVIGPGLQTMDLALVRSFTLTERLRLEMRVEVYNDLSHSNLGTPNRFVNTPQFGSITEASTPGREAQFSARLSF